MATDEEIEMESQPQGLAAEAAPVAGIAAGQTADPGSRPGATVEAVQLPAPVLARAQTQPAATTEQEREQRDGTGDIPAGDDGKRSGVEVLRAWTSRTLGFLSGQLLLIGFGISCVLAYFFPNVAAHGGIIKSQYSVLYGAVAFIFLVSGLQLPHEKLAANLANWRLHALTQGISFVLIPLIQLAIIRVVLAASPDPLHPAVNAGILVGMVVVSCTPTTIASNVVMTRAAGGDDAAAVVEVVVGNVLGSFASPAFIYAYLPRGPAFDAWQPASPRTLGAMYASVARQLALSLLLPLAVGQAVRWRWPRQVGWVLARFHLGKVSTLCLVLVIWSTMSGAFYTGALFILPKSSIAFDAATNAATYALYTLLCFYLARPPARVVEAVNAAVADSKYASRYAPGAARRLVRLRRMSAEETIAVCFCGAAKTTAIGILLVTAMWREADELTQAVVALPVLLYTVEQIFVAQVLVYFFRWYLRRQQRRKGGGATASTTDEESGVGGSPSAGEGVVCGNDPTTEGEKNCAETNVEQQPPRNID